MQQIAVLLLALVTFAGDGSAEDKVHWAYSGEHGPEHWGDLSEAFAACKEGKSQSPIDIVDPIDVELAPIALSYRGSTTAVVNNGHTLQTDVGRDNTLEIDGKTFDLLQFHFHSPSEHRIDGESFPLEAHFVHRNERGELAVVAILFRLGDRNRAMATIVAAAPEKAETSKPLDENIASLEIVPENKAHYRYSGSLTTPPCTEGVLWLVLESIGSVSREQVANFVRIIGEDARGPQPLNGRRVVH
ncbi:MAG: carbonic anhydrase family protein [Deltaproteobacteria bacterium]|jgi:carbonic anhydrase|nr:carbonic anhydrase family protein [Deltaproteobacteria bacterium]MBW2542080.1 carbonic anhydrase family protein [Deltaproteobacteria bacterium]